MLQKIEKEPLTAVNGPPFSIKFFKTYFDMRYQSCGQVGGMEAPNLIEIGPMVLASNIQMLEPRAYDYVEYVIDNIHTSFVNFEDVEYPTFKNYSLLMPMVLYFGKMRGLWGEGLKLNLRESNGEMKLVQMWTPVWNYRFSSFCYLTFEDYFVQPLYTFFGH